MTGDVLLERITPDPDYSTRKGYDPDFLGTGDHQIALPVLPDDLIALASDGRHDDANDFRQTEAFGDELAEVVERETIHAS